MIILFINDNNGHFSKDPEADLVGIAGKVTRKEMEKAELHQTGVMRIGGNWDEILGDCGHAYTILKHGKLSELAEEKYDLKYKVISGNY